MKNSTKTLSRGDTIDKSIGRVLNQLCEDLTVRAQCLNSNTLSKAQKLEKYKESLNIEMATYMPIVKLDPGKYLLGTHERQV